MQRALLIQLALVFVLTQAIGLTLGYALVEARAQGIIETTSVINDNPDDSLNAVALVVQILVMAGVLIAIIRFLPKYKKWFLKILETVAVFTATALVSSLVLPETLALFFAVGLVALRLAFPKDLLLRNIAGILAASAVGALVGVLLGILPILVFVIALSLYDLWAVFGTKHMVELAKNVVPENLAFTVGMPTPEHQFELGTGDLVVPLAFATSVLATTYPAGFPESLALPAGLLIASLLGLIVTLDIVERKIGRALPALPLQTLFMVVVFGATTLLAPLL